MTCCKRRIIFCGRVFLPFIGAIKTGTAHFVAEFFYKNSAKTPQTSAKIDRMPYAFTGLVLLFGAAVGPGKAMEQYRQSETLEQPLQAQAEPTQPEEADAPDEKEAKMNLWDRLTTPDHTSC